MKPMFCRCGPILLLWTVASTAEAQTEAGANVQVGVSTGAGASADGNAPAVPSTSAGGELPYMERYVPEPNLWELGLFGGILFPSKSHRLIEPGSEFAQQPFDPAGELGVRFAYYPLSFLGAEIEGAAMPTRTEDGRSAGLHAGRGHLLAQLPGASITPFLLGGFGVLGAVSEAMGTDNDPAFHFGAGVKAALDAYLLVRLDVRDTLTQRVGGSDGHQTHHPEVLLGLSFTLERSRPDTDGDGFADHRDHCVDRPGPDQGCPPPDRDGDGVLDADDECAEQAGVSPSGCPDSDGDGVLDKSDACPNQVGTSKNGCPDETCDCVDSDADGVTDRVDQCPKEAAHTADGCPSRDADGDGIEDAEDRCPKEPETNNGFEDEDGCPDELPEEAK